MRKSTIPEWAIARERIQKEDSADEVVRDMQFMSYLVVFGSSVEYKDRRPLSGQPPTGCCGWASW